MTLAELGLGPLDVIALPDRPPGTTGHAEIDQRLMRLAWSRRPSVAPGGSTVALMLDRDPAWPVDRLSIDELMTAAASARALITGARAATATNLASPDQPATAAIDNTELQARADQAATALAVARAQFSGQAAPDTALAAAGQFGVMGAVPAIDQNEWPGQAQRVRAKLDARAAQLTALAAGFMRAGASSTALRDHDVARLQTIFGAPFPVVACLTAAAAAALPPLFANSDALLQHQPLEVATWLTRSALARTGPGPRSGAGLRSRAGAPAARRSSPGPRGTSGQPGQKSSA